MTLLIIQKKMFQQFLNQSQDPRVIQLSITVAMEKKAMLYIKLLIITPFANTGINRKKQAKSFGIFTRLAEKKPQTFIIKTLAEGTISKLHNLFFALPWWFRRGSIPRKRIFTIFPQVWRLAVCGIVFVLQ